MAEKVFTVGVIGSGAISDIYLKNMGTMFRNLKVKEISARHPEHAQAKAAQYGIRAVTNEEMLSDPDIDIAVVLTPVGMHYELIRQALEAGKHVYTEKTIAVTAKQAEELCTLADRKGLYLGSAPDTFLGSGLQTARRALEDGKIKEVNSFSIAINRNNDILDSVFGFLRMPGGGALRDYMVYYLTALVSLLGPVKRVSALIRAPYTKRTAIIPGKPDYGNEIDTPNESIISAVLEMESGVTGTIHEDNETSMEDRANFCIYGRGGILLLGDANQFGGKVRFIPAAGDPRQNQDPEVLPVTGIYSDNSRGVGVSEMASAIAEGRPNRASREMAAHVLGVIEAMEKSSESGKFEETGSTFTKPAPMPGRADE